MKTSMKNSPFLRFLGALVLEPYYGMNNKIDSGLIPDLNRVGGDFYTYWFRTEFDLPSDFAGKTVWLDVEGIAFFLQLQLKDEQGSSVKPCFMTDNFFSLLPGEKKTVVIDPSAAKAKAGTLLLRGWNIPTRTMKHKSK